MPTLPEACSLLTAGRYDTVLKALAETPPSPETARLRAAALIGKKRGREALAALAGAEPGHPETLFLTGRAHLLASNAHAAVTAFEALPPDWPGRTEALVGAYRRDALYAEAVALADTVAAPARAIHYERAMALLLMGEAAAALAAFDALNADFPDHAASWVGGAAPAFDRIGAEDAVRRVERAARCPGANGKYWGLAAALHALAGRTGEAAAIRRAHVDHDPRRRPLVDGIEALAPVDARVFGTARALLEFAVTTARAEGLVLEFGVRRGTSIRQLAANAGQDVHGFDSFEGLPESWGNERAGVLTCGHTLPPVPDNVHLHAGWFEDTLPPFLASHPGPVRLVNIDSDIYASARTVLTALEPRLVAGTIVVFDEMIGNRTWRDDEFRAWTEFTAATAVEWEVAALSPFTKQVMIRITRQPRR